MQKTLYHIVSLFVLLLSLVTLTGVATAAAALLPAAAVDACCAGNAAADDSGAEPCPTLDCSCVHCLHFDLAAAAVLPAAMTAEQLLHPSPYALRPADISVAIDYPPEIL